MSAGLGIETFIQFMKNKSVIKINLICQSEISFSIKSETLKDLFG